MVGGVSFDSRRCRSYRPIRGGSVPVLKLEEPTPDVMTIFIPKFSSRQVLYGDGRRSDDYSILCKHSYQVIYPDNLSNVRQSRPYLVFVSINGTL